MIELEYPVAVSALGEDDGGGYIAYAIDLKGCMSDGETPEEAVAGLRPAILEWIDEAKRLGRVVPAPGSAVSKAQNERKQFMELIAAQEKIIAEQSDAYGKLLNEASKLRERARALSIGGEEANAPEWATRSAAFAQTLAQDHLGGDMLS